MMIALADIRVARGIEPARPSRPNWGCLLALVVGVAICLPWWFGVIVIGREAWRALK
jgi:hypothetical protein